MLVVHHLGLSQSERILWLCEELGLPYELKRYERVGGMGPGPPEYKAIYPYGTAPVIQDGDLTMGESGAILEYLMGKYGDKGLKVGPEAPNFADYLYWFHFANGTFMPAGMAALLLAWAKVDPDFVRNLTGRWRLAFDRVEHRLGEAAYFGGEAFTAADIMMLFPLTTMRRFTPTDISGFPNLLAYLQRIGQRPAYQRAMAKGDPDVPPLLT